MRRGVIVLSLCALAFPQGAGATTTPANSFGHPAFAAGTVPRPLRDVFVRLQQQVAAPRSVGGLGLELVAERSGSGAAADEVWANAHTYPFGDVDGDGDVEVVAWRTYYGPGVGWQDVDKATVLDGATGEDLYELDIPGWDEYANNRSPVCLYSYETRWFGFDDDDTGDGVNDLAYAYLGVFDEAVEDGITLEVGLVDGATGERLWKHNVQGTAIVGAGIARYRNVVWNLSDAELAGAEMVIQTVDADDFDPLTDTRVASTGASHLSFIDRATGSLNADSTLPFDGPLPGIVTAGDLDGDGELDMIANTLVHGERRLSLLDRTGTAVAWTATVPAGSYNLQAARYTLGPGTDLVYSWYTDEGSSMIALDGVTGALLWRLPASGLTTWSVTPDLNGDGALDLAATTAGDPISVSYRRGDDLAPIREREYPAALPVTSAHTFGVGDLDGDSVEDLVVRAYVDGSQRKHIYISGATFDPIREESERFPLALYEDADGDGADDLRLGHASGVSILRGVDGQLIHRLDLPPDADLPYIRLANFSTQPGTEFLVWSSDPGVAAMFDATGQLRWTRRYP